MASRIPTGEISLFFFFGLALPLFLLNLERLMERNISLESRLTRACHRRNVMKASFPARHKIKVESLDARVGLEPKDCLDNSRGCSTC